MPKAINKHPGGVNLLDPNKPNDMAFILVTAVISDATTNLPAKTVMAMVKPAVQQRQIWQWLEVGQRCGWGGGCDCHGVMMPH